MPRVALRQKYLKRINLVRRSGSGRKMFVCATCCLLGLKVYCESKLVPGKGLSVLALHIRSKSQSWGEVEIPLGRLKLSLSVLSRFYPSSFCGVWLLNFFYCLNLTVDDVFRVKEGCLTRWAGFRPGCEVSGHPDPFQMWILALVLGVMLGSSSACVKCVCFTTGITASQRGVEVYVDCY